MAVLAALSRPLLAAVLLLLTSVGPSVAVFGGRAVHDSDPLARSVAAILYRDSTGAHLCTAAVLGQRLLLTAAHCTDGNSRDIKVIFATTLTDVGDDRIRTVAAIARAGKTSAGKGKYPYQNPDDVALVVLATGAPDGTRPVKIAGPDTAGTALDIVGYGATSDLRRANALGQRQLGFDGILRSARVVVARTDPALLTADQGRGGGACTGDSGGPALIDGAVAGILIGVSSPRSNNDYCRGTAWFANLTRWHDWIRATARNLGQPLD